jgi:hypothetical protein
LPRCSQIGKQAPQRNDERAALRHAFARRQEAIDGLASHKAAIERAKTLLGRAETKAARATAGIVEAKVEAARHAAEAISRGNDTEASGNGIVRAARIAEASALDEVDALRAVVEQMKAESAEREAAVSRPRSTLPLQCAL